ncbi:uncharacterized protein KGF55_005194 [Candida pseudojiufengensis]|uniref:uncharacterized protein n=1 Tax=Candida pseudojiufengensis TaxID=497109 RepID=UPI002224B544|nr:uncharacterized protein KGF55_005194 [Candida pseudojiufengensis]KAI5959550.1 hypothetical protein KGF55_005194 [Candida pseudojiufengensis]
MEDSNLAKSPADDKPKKNNDESHNEKDKEEKFHFKSGSKPPKFKKITPIEIDDPKIQGEPIHSILRDLDAIDILDVHTNIGPDFKIPIYLHQPILISKDGTKSQSKIRDRKPFNFEQIRLDLDKGERQIRLNLEKEIKREKQKRSIQEQRGEKRRRS